MVFLIFTLQCVLQWGRFNLRGYCSADSVERCGGWRRPSDGVQSGGDPHTANISHWVSSRHTVTHFTSLTHQYWVSFIALAVYQNYNDLTRHSLPCARISSKNGENSNLWFDSNCRISCLNFAGRRNFKAERFAYLVPCLTEAVLSHTALMSSQTLLYCGIRKSANCQSNCKKYLVKLLTWK